MSFAWYIWVILFLSPFPLEQESLNRKVIEFAQSKLGQTVGRGECWDLAQQALTRAQARNSTDYLSQTHNENYIWGNLVSLGKAKPGDIIQYRNFRGKVRETLQNGSWRELSFIAQHHTAILAQPLGEGRWRVYQQNDQGQRFVTQDTINLLDATFQKGTRKIEVNVEGKYWIYRPEAQ